MSFSVCGGRRVELVEVVWYYAVHAMSLNCSSDCFLISTSFNFTTARPPPLSRNLPACQWRHWEGRAGGVTPSGEWHPNEIKCFCSWIIATTLEGGEDVSGDETIAKKGYHFSEDDDQKKSSLFWGKTRYRVTPSVAVPGDSNLSDTTAACYYEHVLWIIFIYMSYVSPDCRF